MRAADRVSPMITEARMPDSGTWLSATRKQPTTSARITRLRRSRPTRRLRAASLATEPPTKPITAPVAASASRSPARVCNGWALRSIHCSTR